jgi:hypothetical protein
MATIYQARTFGDILNAVCEQLSIQDSDTNGRNQVKRDINIIYDEVTNEKNWWWLQGNAQVQLPAYLNTGTVSVTQGSASVTFSSAPTASQRGKYFSVEGSSDIYIIESHTAASTTAKLNDLYSDATSATANYKLWTDRVPLPVDCRETTTVWHGAYSIPMEAKGRQDFRRITTCGPKAEGKPQYYYTGDFSDPTPRSTITSLPTTSTRSSVGVVKTIVFASSLPAAVVTANTAGNPLKWNISGASAPTYNGDIIVSSISTTSSANDTITYTGKGETTEASTADTSITVTQVDTEADYDRYRELFIYPCLNTTRTNLNVDYIKEVFPLEADSDEPVIPKAERNVLMFGALYLAHLRLGNETKSTLNYQLYQNRLKRMSGKHQDSLDKPTLQPSKIYVSQKRNIQGRLRSEQTQGWGGGGGGGQVVSGTASQVAVFGADGVLTASSTISSTELTYLDNVEALTSATLADNTSSATTITSWEASSYSSVIIDYSISRGSGIRESGTIYLTTDASSAAISTAGAALGTSGVTFSTDVSGGSIRLKYTTTSTGTAATMKYSVRKWAN